MRNPNYESKMHNEILTKFISNVSFLTVIKQSTDIKQLTDIKQSKIRKTNLAKPFIIFLRNIFTICCDLFKLGKLSKA